MPELAASGVAAVAPDEVAAAGASAWAANAGAAEADAAEAPAGATEAPAGATEAPAGVTGAAAAAEAPAGAAEAAAGTPVFGEAGEEAPGWSAPAAARRRAASARRAVACASVSRARTGAVSATHASTADGWNIGMSPDVDGRRFPVRSPFFAGDSPDDDSRSGGDDAAPAPMNSSGSPGAGDCRSGTAVATAYCSASGGTPGPAVSAGVGGHAITAGAGAGRASASDRGRWAPTGRPVDGMTGSGAPMARIRSGTWLGSTT